MIDLLKPKKLDSKKIRLGTLSDGGYVLPEIVLDSCDSLFTYGVSYNFDFEIDFAKIYNKPVYMFDHTINKPNYDNDKINFFQIGLGFTENCDDFINHYNNLQKNGKVILKIDIESNEYDYFEKVDINDLADKCICICIEIHGLISYNFRNKAINILKKINQYFILNHIHGNNWSGTFVLDNHLIPDVIELTYVHKSFYDSIINDDSVYPIDGLDYPNNLEKDDYHLEFISNKKINLDLWGGVHYLDTNTLIYYLNRPYGLFSNLTVCMYGIVKYILMGYTPSHIVLKLSEYKSNYDFYPDLFQANENYNIDFSNISEKEFEDFLKYCEPNFLGLGRKKDDVNFNILFQIKEKYFSISAKVQNILDDMIQKHNICVDNTIFIWARKCDKVYEVEIPEINDYLNVIKNNELFGYKIIIQTDDASVLESFTNTNINFTTLNELPYSTSKNGFHNNLNIIDDSHFESSFNLTKIEYLQKLLALAYLASKCKYTITYPGCLTTYIPILKNNFINSFNFKNKNELL